MSEGIDPGYWDALKQSNPYFENLWVEFHTPEALYQWLEANPYRFKEIPEQFHTDQMRLLAMREVPGALSWITAATTPNYLALILQAIDKRPDIIAHVETESLSEEFLFTVVQAMPEAFFYMMRESCDRFNDLVSQRIVDVACSTSPRLIYKMMTDQAWRTPKRIQDMITDEHIAASMRTCSEEVKYLKRMGKLYVLTDMIREGYWPAPEDSICKNDALGSIQSYASQLPSPVDAWRERMKPFNASIAGMGYLDEKIHVFFEAVIKLYPVTNVIQWFNRPEYFEVARDIYPIEDLKPLMREYPQLKRFVLEGELGM